MEQDYARAIYNPHGLPSDELPYIFGFNNGGSPGWMIAQLISEDGESMGSHLCSNEAYMLGDLGIIEGTRPDRHSYFREHYPNGYRMEFVQLDDERLQAAFKAHDAKYPSKDAGEVQGCS